MDEISRQIQDQLDQQARADFDQYFKDSQQAAIDKMLDQMIKDQRCENNRSRGQ